MKKLLTFGKPENDWNTLCAIYDHRPGRERPRIGNSGHLAVLLAYRTHGMDTAWALVDSIEKNHGTETSDDEGIEK